MASNPPSSPPRVVLVTGAARRIGRAIALRFGAAGWTVAVHFRNSATEARQTLDLVQRAGGAGAVFQADLTRDEETAGLAADVEAAFGRVDVIVNNASHYAASPLLASSAEDTARAADGHHALHVRAPLLLTQALAPGMCARGGGAIVNLGDACLDRPRFGAYAASKAGLRALTRTLARELAPQIRVNMVSPGAVLPSHDAADAEFELVVSRVPMGRAGTVEEVADAVWFLATGPEFVTGQDLRVDGGRY